MGYPNVNVIRNAIGIREISAYFNPWWTSFAFRATNLTKLRPISPLVWVNIAQIVTLCISLS